MYKKRYIYMLSFILIVIMSFPTFAASIDSTSKNSVSTNSSEENTISSNTDKSQYTLSDDNITWYKIVSGDGVYLIDGKPRQFSEEEYRIYRKAQKTNYLTEEQIAQGWILFNGYAYPPQ